MKKRIVALFLCVILSLSGPLFAGPSFEGLGLPRDAFPASSEYHRVNSVGEDPVLPGFLIFTVSAGGTETQVEGLADLKKWIRETMVIGKLDQDKSTSEGVVEGAAESIKGTGRGLKNLVFHPVDSAKGLGKATGKIGGKIGGAFSKKEEGEKGDTFLSSTKRQIAKKLGVDVYSRNPQLQEKLSSLAKQEMGGRGIVMAATFFMPLGLLASAVMTASSINNAADELVNDKDRGELYAVNKDALLALGFPLAKVKALLNHPYYTPREVTYVRFYLEKLHGLGGSGALLDEAIRLRAHVPAQKFLHEMQIAADAVGTANDAQTVRIVPQGLLLEQRNAVVLITGYDYIEASPLGDQAVKEVLGAKSQLRKSSAEIWNAGIVASKFDAGLVFKGIKTRRMCLFGSSAAGAEQAAE